MKLLKNIFLITLPFAVLLLCAVGAKENPPAKTETPKVEKPAATLPVKKAVTQTAATQPATPAEKPETTTDETNSVRLLVPSIPSDTLVVARLKNVDALDKAMDAFKDWVRVHPSVQSLFDEEWEKVEQFDLRHAAAEYLDLSPEDFNKFFDGAITLYISGDFATAKQSKMLPVAIEFATRSAQSAKDFADLLKDEDDVIDATDVAEGVQKITVSSPSADSEDDTPTTKKIKKSDKAEKTDDTDQTMEIFLALSGENVILGSSLEYTTAVLKAHQNPTASAGMGGAFWSRVAGSDAAAWMDPRPFFQMVKDEIQARDKDDEEKKTRAEQVFDGLGLSEIEGVGLHGNLTPIDINVELSYTAPPTGIAKIFTCAPTGLEATPLLPADVNEFCMGRIDVACLWGEVRRIAKIVMPASEPIYDGWKKQLQDNSGVDFERQLINALGSTYVVYSRDSLHEPMNSAIYVSLNDSDAIQNSITAFIKFFTQGKDLFDHEKINNVPVWRLKSEFQSPNAPPIAYAVTPQWLIVSIGDPTQMQDLIENANAHTVTNKVLSTTALKEVLSSGNLIGLNYRPLRVILADAAAAAQKWQQRQAAAQNNGVASEAPDQNEETPTFEDVNENLLIYTESKPGIVQTTIKVLPADESNEPPSNDQKTSN